jgi:CheY-like chemotaxis protein
VPIDWESPGVLGIIAAIGAAAVALLAALGKGLAALGRGPKRIIDDQAMQLDRETARRRSAEVDRDDARGELAQVREAGEQCDEERDRLRAVLAAMGMPGRQLRVVVVDDEPLFRGWMRRHLESIGVAVPGDASSGADGVRLALGLRPDVVLMDLRMPGGIDGVEATRQIVEAWPEARVLVLTGGGEPDREAAAIEAGAYACLQKVDTDSAALMAQLTRAMRGRR